MRWLGTIALAVLLLACGDDDGGGSGGASGIGGSGGNGGASGGGASDAGDEDAGGSGGTAGTGGSGGGAGDHAACLRCNGTCLDEVGDSADQCTLARRGTPISGLIGTPSGAYFVAEGALQRADAAGVVELNLGLEVRAPLGYADGTLYFASADPTRVDQHAIYAITLPLEGLPPRLVTGSLPEPPSTIAVGSGDLVYVVRGLGADHTLYQVALPGGDPSALFADRIGDVTIADRDVQVLRTDLTESAIENVPLTDPTQRETLAAGLHASFIRVHGLHVWWLDAGHLRRVPLAGGAVEDLGDTGALVDGWQIDDQHAYASSDESAAVHTLGRLAVAGGTLETLYDDGLRPEAVVTSDAYVWVQVSAATGHGLLRLPR